MATTTFELFWLWSFLASLGVFHRNPMKLYCDNQAALHLDSNPIFHECTKHIEIDCHFVRERIIDGYISITYV